MKQVIIKEIDQIQNEILMKIENDGRTHLKRFLGYNGFFKNYAR